MIDSPARGDAILVLRVTNRGELISKFKVGGSWGCSDHTVVEFIVLKDIVQAKGKVRTLNFRNVKKEIHMIRVVQHQRRLTREAADAPSLETFQTRLYRALNNLI